MKIHSFWLVVLFLGVAVTSAVPANAIDAAKAKTATHTNPPNRLPPVGIEIPAAARHALEQRLHELESAGSPLAQDPLWADVAMLLKAVRYALLDGEFYVPKDVEKAKRLLQLAESRLADLKKHQPRWTKQTGTLVRGFVSGIDGTPQPIGLEIPADLDLSKPVPLTVWLHGRGDKVTDMHFIDERMHKPGQFQPGGCIIVHPFGRQCLGYQLAGEADVMEAMLAAKRMYRIDERRILLAGFSMGGAGAWHVGAHYAEYWCGLHAGAGFVDVKRFMNLTPVQFPPVYTQTLWGQYDVPDCVRNLFNIPVLAYSGEVDKQKLAADIMAEAYEAEGQKLHQLIGPGMGHKYDQASLKEIEAWAHERMQVGQPDVSRAVHWQGRTLKYARMFWLTVWGLQKHWEDSRVDADWEGPNLNVTTKNVTQFMVYPTWAGHALNAEVKVTVINTSDDVWFYKPSDHKTRWRGHEKEIPLGPDVQQVLEPFMKRDPQAFLFSPQESVAWQAAHEPAYHAWKRKTKVYPCEVKRLAKNKEERLKHTRKRPIGDRYDTNAYRHALIYGFNKARKMGYIIPHWHPHQLRHSRATEIRKLFGLEAAQVALGHKSADITQVYAEKNMERATEIAKAMG